MNKRRNINYIRLMITGLLILCAGLDAYAQQIFNQEKEKEDTVMILEFGWDQSENADLIAAQAGWMVRKALRAGKFDLPEIKERSYNDKLVIWKNRALLRDFFTEQSVEWLIAGDILNVSRDPDGDWVGPRVFGVAGIPVKAEIAIHLFDCRSGRDAWNGVIQVRGNVHRLRVFGISSSPIPKTPAAIEALIHSAVLEISDKLIPVINTNNSQRSL